MSTAGWIALALLALAWAVAMLGARKWRREAAQAGAHWLQAHQRADDQTHTLMDLNAAVMGVLPDRESPRYEVLLSDWGPDFTGTDGTLPRWRWSVVDADRDLRIALGLIESTDMGTVEMPYMLGNEHAGLNALSMALHWIEQQGHPLQQVVVTTEPIGAED